MIQSLDTLTLTRYVTKQVNNLLPDVEVQSELLAPFVKQAIERVEYCFSRINNEYFFDGRSAKFDHLHADQYSMFLYYLSNTIWRQEKDETLAAKIYYLNRALNGLNIFYKVALPDIFHLIHCVGIVLGRAEYNDYFVATQRVTIGANKNFEYPVLGKGVAVYGGSAIIGKCKIGDNCLISVNTTVMETDIPDNMVVFDGSPDISYKRTTKSVIERFFIA